MEQATQEEVRRKMADEGRDKFSVLIADTPEALAELYELVHDGGVWWEDGVPHQQAGKGRQRVGFVRMGTAAADDADRAEARRNRR